MAYTLNWSDPALKPTSIVISSGILDTTSTSILLNGNGKINWGITLDQNFLYLLENFASSNGISPAHATLGQLWYDANKKHLNLNGLNLYNSGSSFQELAYRRIDNPTPPILISYQGDTWYDTTNNFLNVYNTSWNRIAFDVQTIGNFSEEIIGSAANAYKILLDSTVVPTTGPNHNIIGRIRITNSNTLTSVTIDLGGSLPKIMLNSSGGALGVGDLQAGKIYTFIYIHVDDRVYLTSEVLSQTSGVYAALHGNSIDNFACAPPAGSNDAVPLGYADGRYAKLAGLSTQTFSVATATTSSEAVPKGQADVIYAPISATNYLVPTGVIIDFAGPTPPAGYLACPNAPNAVASVPYSSQLISITSYPALFAALGYMYGGALGSTFGIPWFKDGFTTVSSPHGSVGQETFGDVKAHTHTYERAVGAAPQSGSATPCLTSTITDNTGSTGNISGNLAAGIYILKCIKY